MLVLRHRLAIAGVISTVARSQLTVLAASARSLSAGRRRIRASAMSASASRDEAVLPRGDRESRPSAVRGIRLVSVEAVVAFAAFAALCVVVLSFTQQTGVEPDDGAYRASIVAMTEGNFLTLSSAQVDALAAQLDDAPDQAPNQWVELPGGRYISEKAPAIRSWRHRSRHSASSAGRRCSTGRWPAWGCSSAPAAGSGGSAAWLRWACTAHPGRRCCSPGAITCRHSPTPR
jgi:hypothetical protein